MPHCLIMIWESMFHGSEIKTCAGWSTVNPSLLILMSIQPIIGIVLVLSELRKHSLSDLEKPKLRVIRQVSQVSKVANVDRVSVIRVASHWYSNLFEMTVWLVSLSREREERLHREKLFRFLEQWIYHCKTQSIVALLTVKLGFFKRFIYSTQFHVPKSANVENKRSHRLTDWRIQNYVSFKSRW
jgi:hypothetical protein